MGFLNSGQGFSKVVEGQGQGMGFSDTRFGLFVGTASCCYAILIYYISAEPLKMCRDSKNSDLNSAQRRNPVSTSLLRNLLRMRQKALFQNCFSTPKNQDPPLDLHIYHWFVSLSGHVQLPILVVLILSVFSCLPIHKEDTIMTPCIGSASMRKELLLLLKSVLQLRTYGKITIIWREGEQVQFTAVTLLIFLHMIFKNKTKKFHLKIGIVA